MCLMSFLLFVVLLFFLPFVFSSGRVLQSSEIIRWEVEREIERELKKKRLAKATREHLLLSYRGRTINAPD